MEMSSGIAVSGVRMLWGVKHAEIENPASRFDLSAIAAVVSADALQTDLVAGADRLVRDVLGMRGLAQIGKAIVGLIDVAVIEAAERPRPLMHCPDYAVSANFLPSDRDV